MPPLPHLDSCHFCFKSQIQPYSATIHSIFHIIILMLFSARADAPATWRTLAHQAPAAISPLSFNPMTLYHLHVSVNNETAAPLNSNLLQTLCPDPWLRPASLSCHANLIQKHFLWQPVNVRADFLYLLCSPAKRTAWPLCQEPSLV